MTAGEQFTIEESATISSVTYAHHRNSIALADRQILTSLSSTPVTRISNVQDGGVFTLKQGDTHTDGASHTIDLPVTDVGGTLHGELTDAGVASIAVGLRKDGGSASEISGTVTKADITHASDVTTIPLTFAADAAANQTVLDWKYDIQVTLSGGEKITKVSGNCILDLDNAT